MASIYYVFRKETGEFSGSGTPYYDDAEYGCTETPLPEFDSEVIDPSSFHWNGTEWLLTEA